MYVNALPDHKAQYGQSQSTYLVVMIINLTSYNAHVHYAHVHTCSK